jgi:outer membrane protein OmpA-like peptidoglycan-associated protein
VKTRIQLRLIALALAIGSADAGAQIRLDRYSAPLSPGDGLRLSRPTVLGHREVGGLLAVDYADDPLVLELERGLEETETARLVETQLQAHARFAYGVHERVMIGVGFEFAMVQTGEGWADRATGTVIAPDDGSGIGDAQIGARYLAIGGDDEIVALAFDGKLILPLARGANSDQNLSGERGVAGGPEAIFEARPGPARITANLGALVRRDARLFDTNLGDEMTFGLGASVQLPGDMRRFEAIAEAYGSTATADVFGGAVTPIEALIGGRWSPSERWRVSLAGGRGLSRGIGSPDVRALASLGLIAMPELDPDNDSLYDDNDSCPNDAEDHDGFQDEDGCPDPDDDSDGVIDAVDRCRSEPEDRDSFRDEDGCPDLDNDGDGVPDAADRCGAEAEDIDGDQDSDGCPDLDSDGDGVPDTADRCATAAEDADQFQDEDGCPDADNDADGVPDAEDACPIEAGVSAEKGCPVATSQVHVEGGVIRIDQRIEFAQGGADLLAVSDAILDEIRSLLEKRPDLRLVAIEGHADGKGGAIFNQRLSEQRAQSVARWLAEHGITPSRLSAWGCGKSRPLEPETSPEAQQKNRRVELHVIDPAPPEPHSSDGCRQVPVSKP